MLKTNTDYIKRAPSSEFVSSSIPSWQILTAHAQPFRRARDLTFCLKVPLDSLLVWASSKGSGETARMCRLAWTFAARIGDKYQIRLTRSKRSKGLRAYRGSFNCWTSVAPAFKSWYCCRILSLFHINVESWFTCLLFWLIDELRSFTRTEQLVCLRTTAEPRARVAAAWNRFKPPQ